MIFNRIIPEPRQVLRNVNRGLSPVYIDREYAITIVLSGQGTMLLDGVRYNLGAGDILLLEPLQRHILNATSELLQFVIHFTLERGVLPSASSGAVISTTPEEFRIFCEECFLIERELRDREKFYEIRAQASLLKLLGLYLGKRETMVPEVNLNHRLRSNLERAVNCIHANFRRKLEIGEIARAAHLSPNYLCRVFREATGGTLHRYLNVVRIGEAKELIRQEKLTLSEIAEETGFPSIHLFSRVFREIEGIPPSHYAAGLTKLS